MRKNWKKVLLWLAGTLIILLAAFITILYANRDKIIHSVVTESNKLLSVPVEVGEVDVSLRKFPLASLRFTEVYCPGYGGSTGDTLLYTSEMFFEFSLWNLLTSDLSIERISLHHGTVHIRMPEDNLPNYQIWRSDSTQESSALFTLEEVFFEDFRLAVDHQSSAFYAAGQVNTFELSGTFADNDYRLQCSPDMHVDSLLLETTTYLQEVPVTGSFSLRSNGEQTFIEDGEAVVEDIAVNFTSGIFEELVTVKASREGVNLKSLWGLIKRQNWASLPENVEVNGKAALQFHGEFPNDQPMVIRAGYQTSGASISGLYDARIRDLSLTGRYLLEDGTDKLVLKNFSGRGHSGQFTGGLQITDFSNPYVVLDLKSDLALSEWLLLLPLDTLQNPSGRAVVDLHLENRFGSLSEIKPEELKRSKARGSFKLEEISFNFKTSDKRIEALNGDLVFNDNDLRVNSFFFRTGRSDIYLSGIFGNVLNYLFFAEQRLFIDTRVRSQELVMEDFITSGTGGDEDYNLDFVRSVDLNLNLEVNRFTFDRFHATDISGQLDVNDGVITGRSLKMKADEGLYNGGFTIDTRPESHYLLAANLVVSNVNMHDLFMSFRDFGQEAIAADNIYGQADANMRMTAVMSKNLEVDPATVDLTARLIIQNGNLKNYEPMLALSRFARIDELKDVRFDRLENEITIRNSEVVIPQMNVNSNVMDLAIRGRHRFDNTIDYTMRLKLSDVLFKQRSRKSGNTEFDKHLVEVEQEDEPNIFISMTGSAIDPAITLDREAISQSISHDLKEQKKELKKIFDGKKENSEEKNSGIQFDLFGDDDKDDKK